MKNIMLAQRRRDAEEKRKALTRTLRDAEEKLSLTWMDRIKEEA
jgi:hypothetical protein